MNIVLSADLESIVRRQVETGQYTNPAEVVREGLLLLSARDDLLHSQQDQLRSDIAIGLAQAERGDVKPFDAADLLRRVEERFVAETRIGIG